MTEESMTFEDWLEGKRLGSMELEFARDAWDAATRAEREARDDLAEQLAASQAREKQMREALHYSLGAWHYDGISEKHGSIFKEANARCDAPTNLDALHEALAQECESILVMLETIPFSNTYEADIKSALCNRAVAHRMKKAL